MHISTSAAVKHMGITDHRELPQTHSFIINNVRVYQPLYPKKNIAFIKGAKSLVQGQLYGIAMGGSFMLTIS